MGQVGGGQSFPEPNSATLSRWKNAPLVVDGDQLTVVVGVTTDDCWATGGFCPVEVPVVVPEVVDWFVFSPIA